MLLKYWAVFLVIILVTISGCSKKVTKTEQITPAGPDKVAFKQEPESTQIRETVRINDFLATIYFDYDQSTLRPEGVHALERLGPFLMQHSSVRLMAEGHCDERGSSEYNMGLGEKRSKTVRQWLVSYGINASRIEYTSYGKERIVNPGCRNEVCHSMNRRVEWKVLSIPDEIATVP